MAIQARQMTLAATLERNASIHPENTALVCRSAAVSYSALNSRVDRLAGAFSSRGVSNGTRVALLMRNCHQFIEVIYALSKIGGVLVPLNWRLAPSELLHVLRDSDSMILVHGGGLEENVSPLRAELGTGIEAIDMADLARSADAQPAKRGGLSEVCDDDIAVQMYTAAFGGRPRGAQITHGGYLASAISVSMALSLSDADSSLIAVPLFHAFGLEIAMATLVLGGKCVLVDPFEAADVVETIERERVSILPCAGKQLEEITQELQGRPRDISSLRLVIGSAASKEMRESVRRLAPKARFVDAVYGQTECGVMVAVCDTEEAEAIGDHCVGRPTIYMDVRVFGEGDAELQPKKVGEIVVRGPRVMAGYWGLPDVNQETFRNGWLHTGDLGMFDEEGYLHYVGRKRELIKSGMENVYPVEVETVLAAHPAVREVAVIGVPDGQWGEAVTAIVALNEGCAVSAAELVGFCKERIASYKKPKYVRFVNELPRDATGEVSRGEIRARYGGTSGDRTCRI